jgi:hypothetical protein
MAKAQKRGGRLGWRQGSAKTLETTVHATVDDNMKLGKLVSQRLKVLVPVSERLLGAHCRTMLASTRE